MKVLVVGGAGYIGSRMVQDLLDTGHEPVTLDSLVTGHRDAVLGGSCKEIWPIGPCWIISFILTRSMR
jgi:UDP-glucose 4-epimerase